MKTITLPMIDFHTEMSPSLEGTGQFSGLDELLKHQTPVWVNLTFRLRDHSLLARMKPSELAKQTESFRQILWQVAQASSAHAYGLPVSIVVEDGSLLVVISLVISLAANYTNLKQSLPVIAADIQFALSLILKSIEHDVERGTEINEPRLSVDSSYQTEQKVEHAAEKTKHDARTDSVGPIKSKSTPRVKKSTGPEL